MRDSKIIEKYLLPLQVYDDESEFKLDLPDDIFFFFLSHKILFTATTAELLM